MPPTFKARLCAMAGTLVLAAAVQASPETLPAQTDAQSGKQPTRVPQVQPQQFVYVLRVAPALHDASRWTAADNAAVGRHFARLSAATKAGQVIFAGKTSEPLDTTFGLVVFEAENEAAARQFMAADPAVAAGVMTATLHPYALALQRKVGTP